MARQSCERLKRDFIKLRTRHKRARGKHRTRIVKQADVVEHSAVKANCAWAGRIFGWDIEKE